MSKRKETHHEPIDLPKSVQSDYEPSISIRPRSVSAQDVSRQSMVMEYPPTFVKKDIPSDYLPYRNIVNHATYPVPDGLIELALCPEKLEHPQFDQSGGQYVVQCILYGCKDVKSQVVTMLNNMLVVATLILGLTATLVSAPSIYKFDENITTFTIDSSLTRAYFYILSLLCICLTIFVILGTTFTSHLLSCCRDIDFIDYLDRYGHWIGIGWKCFVSFGIIFLTCLCINYHMVYLKLDAWILVGVTGVAFVLAVREGMVWLSEVYSGYGFNKGTKGYEVAKSIAVAKLKWMKAEYMKIVEEEARNNNLAK